jgi:hypothetical protein
VADWLQVYEAAAVVVDWRLAHEGAVADYPRVHEAEED